MLADDHGGVEAGHGADGSGAGGEPPAVGAVKNPEGLAASTRRIGKANVDPHMLVADAKTDDVAGGSAALVGEHHLASEPPAVGRRRAWLWPKHDRPAGLGHLVSDQLGHHAAERGIGIVAADHVDHGRPIGEQLTDWPTRDDALRLGLLKLRLEGGIHEEGHDINPPRR